MLSTTYYTQIAVVNIIREPMIKVDSLRKTFSVNRGPLRTVDHIRGSRAGTGACPYMSRC